MVDGEIAVSGGEIAVTRWDGDAGLSPVQRWARDEARRLVTRRTATATIPVSDPVVRRALVRDVVGGDDDDGDGGGGDVSEFTVTVPLVAARCPAVIRYGTSAAYRGLVGEQCPAPAGSRTDHLGYGHCAFHGGRRGRRRILGAWLMGHAYGRELNCTPWEGLLRAVRIAAGKVAYCETVLAGALHDRELEGRVRRVEPERDPETGKTVTGGVGLLLDPDTGEPLGVGQFRDRSWWVTRSELWTDRLARYSKMAIDAGVAERLVAQLGEEAQLVAQTLLNVITDPALDLSEHQLEVARARLRRELLALDEREANGGGGGGDYGDGGGGRVIEGRLTG